AQLLHVLEAAADRLLGVDRILDPEAARRRRHDLEEPERADPALPRRIEVALLVDLRRDQPPIEAVQLGVLAQQWIVGRERAGLAGVAAVLALAQRTLRL